jgi:hypothetical protein
MGKSNSYRILIIISTIILFVAAFVGCGGVAKNPSTPGWEGKDAEGKTGSTTGEKGVEAGAPEIKEGASYQELFDTGVKSLEGGFILNASNAFKEAVTKDKEKPDATLAYVITKLAGSPAEMSLLMEPGIDFLTYNTPLIGRWEFFPAPLTVDDSYLLRLVSLGALYSSINKSQQPTTPTLPAGSGAGLTSPTGGKPGNGTPDKVIPDKGGSLGDGSGGRITQMAGGGRGLEQAATLGGGDLTKPGGEKIQYTGGETEKKVQFLSLDKDILADNLSKYKDLSRSFSAGYLNLGAVSTSSKTLSDLVDDLVTKLEYNKSKVENEPLALELPFKLDAKDGVYRMYFTNYDYMIILGYLKMIQGELKYRSAYNSTAASWVLFTPPADANADNILSPSEYYPASPYGELVEKGDEVLTDAFGKISEGLGLLIKNLDLMYNDERLADFKGNILIPINIDNLLLENVANQRDAFSNFQVILTAGKGDMTFKSPFGDVKAEVNISKLFDKEAPASVSNLLPNLDSVTYDPVISANNSNFPDPTWGGVFPKEMDDFDVFRTRGNIEGNLTYQGTGIKDVTIAISPEKSATTNEKGQFSFTDIDLNELVGIKVSVSSKDLKTPADAQIRSLWVAVDLQSISGDAILTKPSGGEAGAAASGAGAAAGTGISSKIDEIKQKTEEEKEKQGDGTGTAQDGTNTGPS